MRFHSIVLESNEISESAYSRLVSSTNHNIERFKAVEPQNVNKLMNDLNLNWNYPWDKEIFDHRLNLFKKPYSTKNPNKRIACALSHYILWLLCADQNENFVILEHDAIFLKDIDFDVPEDHDIIGLNDPRGATRLSNTFHKIIQESNEKFVQIPIIDDLKIPQGLAGNSAYIIKPVAAKYLIALVEEEGLWPNDALMCRQLVPKMAVTKEYYTKVQGLPSTTTL